MSLRTRRWAAAVASTAVAAALLAAQPPAQAIAAGTDSASASNVQPRVVSAPWGCEPVFFQSAVRSDDTNFQKLYTYSPVNNTFAGIGLNQDRAGTQVLGYNTADNYLYELVKDTTSTAGNQRMHLLRIDDSAVYTPVNTWSVPDQFNVGDFWNRDDSPVLVTGSDVTDSWRLIDVSNTNASSTQSSGDFTITGSGSSPSFKGKDIVIQGNTGYGLHDDTLHVLDLNTRVVRTKAVTFSAGGRGSSSGFGSAYADAVGNLYFFENSTSQVWQIPAEDVKLTNPTLCKVGSGPAYVAGSASAKLQAENDGASCPNARSPYSATITGQTATSITDDTATLTATVNPNSISTTAKICYGTSNQTSGGRLVGCTESAASANSPLTGSAPISLTPITLTGLTSRTTYYWQVVTSSTWATTYGGTSQFTTTAIPEATTSPATGISAASATLNGIVNPGGRSTDVAFCYGTAANLNSCSSINAAQSPLAVSTDDTAVSASVTGLAPGTTYYARVSATNADGDDSGTIVSFTTSAIPLVSLGTATDVTPSDARLVVQVNPKGLPTTVAFCWGLAPDLTSCTSTPALQSPLLAIDDSIAVSADLTGLSASTQYYMRVSATNANGGATTSIGSFTTAPTPLTLSTTTGALPPANVGSAYSKALTAGGGTAPYTWAVASGTLPAGLTLNTSSGVISGTPTVDGATSFVIRVTDSSNPSASATRTYSISTGAPPTATTSAVTSVAGTTATLNGIVDPGNLLTAVDFCYGTTSNLDGCTSISASESPVTASTSPSSVSVGLTGLTMGTTYYARVTATNSDDSSTGSIVSFTTTNLPSVTTGVASFLRTSGTEATLSGTVNPNGLTTNVFFCYGTTPTLAGCTSMPGGTLSASRNPSAVSADITGLTPSAVYYFTVWATNSLGTTAGSTATFTMPSASAVGPAITSVTPTSGPVAGGTTVTITGTNFATTGSFPTVLFDDSAATVTARTTTSITATSPAALYPGLVDVIVANPDGQAYKKVDAFTYTSTVRYDVTYVGNGWTSGTVPTDDTAYQYDDTVTVAAAGTMVRSGYSFDGWNTTANGTGTAYAAGFQYRIHADDTLYAQWLPVAIEDLSDDTVNFGQQSITSGSSDRAVAVINAGAAAMTVTGISLTGDDSTDFDIDGGTCSDGSTVTGNSSCTIDLAFAPSQLGSRSASLQVTTTAGTLTGALVGVGTAVGVPGLSPGTLAFGSRQVSGGASAPQTATLTNSGAAALTITSVSVTGADASDFSRSGGSCSNGASIAPAASCTIAVTFDPSQSGARTATLQVVTSEGTVTSALTGTGNAPTPPPSPSSPPGAPRAVAGTAGDSAVIVTWEAPASAGSFPITDYEVTATPGDARCAVQAPARECLVTGLENGKAYTFRVRALNGAGWGNYSTPSEPVTPQAGPDPSILIVGGRDEANPQRVWVTGSAAALIGESVTPHFRFPGQMGYRTGVRSVVVDPEGTFTWQRRAGKQISVYFSSGDVRSNTVKIPKRTR